MSCLIVVQTTVHLERQTCTFCIDMTMLMATATSLVLSSPRLVWQHKVVILPESGPAPTHAFKAHIIFDNLAIKFKFVFKYVNKPQGTTPCVYSFHFA